MIRKQDVLTQIDCAQGGEGVLHLAHWLDETERCENLGLVATITVEVGGSVGDHTHHGEAEIYRAVSGRALYNDNGTEVEVGPGDVMVCYAGQTHGVKTLGDEEFVFIAIIVKG